MYVRAVIRRRTWLIATVTAFVVFAQVFPVMWRPLGAVVEIWTGYKRPVVEVGDSVFMAIATEHARRGQRKREPVVYKDSPPVTSPARRAPPVEYVPQSTRGGRKRPLEGSTRRRQHTTDRYIRIIQRCLPPCLYLSLHASPCRSLLPPSLCRSRSLPVAHCLSLSLPVSPASPYLSLSRPVSLCLSAPPPPPQQRIQGVYIRTSVNVKTDVLAAGRDPLPTGNHPNLETKRQFVRSSILSLFILLLLNIYNASCIQVKHLLKHIQVYIYK